jgi:hypothetical protein
MMPGDDVATFDVSYVMKTRAPAQQGMGFTADRIPFLLLFPHVQQANGGAGATQDIPHVDAAEVCEPNQLTRRTIDVSAAVQNEHWLAGGGEKGGDGGPLDPIVQPQEKRGGGEQCAGVPRRDECIRAAGLLQSQPNDDAGFAFTAHCRERLLRHTYDFSRLVDLETAAVGIGIFGQFSGYDFGASHQLNDEVTPKRREGLERAGDLRLRGVIAPHRVHRDADHAQTSSTSTCFFPR